MAFLFYSICDQNNFGSALAKILAFVKYFHLIDLMNDLTQRIREFNRFYTAILGLANKHILASDYSFTEARVIYEINHSNGISAREIKEKLQLDEGYLSRIVNKLVKQGVIVKQQSNQDKRLFLLSLSAKGLQELAEINHHSNLQVENLTKHLNKDEKQKLNHLLQEAKQLLERGAANPNTSQKPTIKFSIAYNKQDFDEGKKLFKAYAEALSFDLEFQNFDQELKNIKHQYASPRSALILCYVQQEAIGCVAIRKINDDTAELKRFYVQPNYRGLKIGKQLLELAIDKAKELNYTFVRLDSAPEQSKAQELYKAFGFYEIAPYGYNPLEGVVYMECVLK